MNCSKNFTSEQKHKGTITVASLNINRGLFEKEDLITHLLTQEEIGIVGLHEVDLKHFDDKKPFTIEGYETYYNRKSTIKRSICLVREDIEARERSDLMCSNVSSIWIELQGADGKKILVCQYYREFSDLGNKKLTIAEQSERFKEFCDQIEKATNEAFVICLGDLNIDNNKLNDDSYYLKTLADEYKLMLGFCGLISLELGITWRCLHDDGTIFESAIDHALTNRPGQIVSHKTKDVGYSDHFAVIVEVKKEQ